MKGILAGVDSNRFQHPGDPTPQSIIMLYACANIDNKYSSVAQRYLSAQA